MSKKQQLIWEKLEDEIIADLLEMSIEEIEDELQQEGHDLRALEHRLKSCLARAQDQVIAAKLASAKTSQKKVGANRVANDRAIVRTLAARNAKRPLGLDDPTVDDDLRELRSADWDDN